MCLGEHLHFDPSTTPDTKLDGRVRDELLYCVDKASLKEMCFSGVSSKFIIVSVDKYSTLNQKRYLVLLR